MTANQRRPGFRLPWSSEMDEQAGEGAPGAETPGTEETAESTTPAASTEHPTEQPAPAAENAAPDASDKTDASAETETSAKTDAPAEPADPTAPAEAAETPAPAADADAASDDAKPESPSESASQAPANPSEPEPTPDDFLRDLVAAMRKVADEARDSGVQELKARADDHVRRLDGDAERRREELRTRTEKDVAEVGEWAKAEAERISQEADQRVAARRAQLEQQLAADEHRTEVETTAIRERVAEYERELDAYHDQLLQINDPAAFAAAAKRMPQPPSLTPGAKAAQPVAAPATTPATSAVTTLATPQPAPNFQPAQATKAEDTATPVEPVEPAPTNGVPEVATQVHPAEEEVLAARLAQLDATLPTEPSAAGEPAAAGSAEPATTEVVVKGLGSFGAITGFRQALSGVAGIDGVALSLGQTGEFVFRATHATGFDIRAAIAGLEGDGAKIEDRPGGGLRVTLERAR